MHTITFYSFKGGVGRTMALVNVAAELVRWGRTVLVVDFDLEAPGLETFNHLRPPKPRPGIVEYITKFEQSMQVPEIQDYIFEATETKPIGKNGGKLFVMPAGKRDRDYRRALVNLDWKRLYNEHDGFLLFEETKLAWEQEYKPDYVLIDSRTGDTDLLGICTRQLPDSVVLMFVPNEQNLAGMKNVVNDIRREETEGLKKLIELHFVAANVPDLDDENEILEKQLRCFKAVLGFERLTATLFRYENLELLDQSIVVLDRPRAKLARAYRELVQTLAKGNPSDRDGAILWLQEYSQSLVPKIEYDLEWALNRRLRVEDTPSIIFSSPTPIDGFDDAGEAKKSDPLNKVANFFSDDIEILDKMAVCWILRGDFRSAVRVLDHSLRREPNQLAALTRRALCRINLGQLTNAADDYLASLHLLQKKPHEAAKILWKLSEIAPDHLIEASDIVLAAGFNRIELANLLASTDIGIGKASRMLRELVASLDEEQRRAVRLRASSLGMGGGGRRLHDSPTEAETMRSDLLWFTSVLILARCWHEVIELYGCIQEQLQYKVVFYLAIAKWAETGTMPQRDCIRAMAQIEDFKEQRRRFNENSCWHPQPETEIWLLWGAGRVADAQAILGNEEYFPQEAKAQRLSLSGNWNISPWSLRMVSDEQYFADCQLVRRFFQGEELCPAFLGPNALK